MIEQPQHVVPALGRVQFWLLDDDVPASGPQPRLPHHTMGTLTQDLAAQSQRSARHGTTTVSQ